jgi:hypothetical protein
MTRPDLRITVKEGDVLKFPCNVLVLKYAQAWHGADQAVAAELDLGKGWSLGWDFVAPGQFRFVETNRKLKADIVLFEGVPPLNELTYAKIRQFSRSAMLHVQETLPDARHIAVTIHGVNIGMDERESFLSQLAGILEALDRTGVLSSLEEITFVEKNTARAGRLACLLAENYAQRPPGQGQLSMSAPVAAAGIAEREKPHVFVAMPFSPEMVDVFVFGIEGPVRAAGYLCERVDMAAFTGDVLERIRTRIETSRLVIADLTGANANVYLEVGYAWGREVPALFVCRQGEELKFDVKGHRCLFYASIHELSKMLAAELRVLAG